MNEDDSNNKKACKKKRKITTFAVVRDIRETATKESLGGKMSTNKTCKLFHMFHNSCS